MSFFYGDVKSDELKTANGLQLQGGVNNSYTLTLDTYPALASNYTLNFPSTIGTADQYLKITDVDLVSNTANLSFDTVSGGSVALNNITTGSAESDLATSTGNINFKLNTSDTVMIMDSNKNSVLIPVNSKISFVTNTANIYGSGGSLYIRTGQSSNVSIHSDALIYGDETVTGNINICNDQLSIDYENNNINLKNTQTNKDTVFKVNSATEILRLIGSNNVVRVPGSLSLMDNTYSVNMQAHPTTTSSYTLNMPATIGTQNQSLIISSVSGTTANLGFTTISSTTALDDIATGDAQSTLFTTTGNVLIKSGDDDIVLRTGTTSNVISGFIGSTEILQVNTNGIETKTGSITSVNSLKTANGIYAGSGYTELEILPGVKNHNINNTVSTGNIDFNLNSSINVLKLEGTDNSVRIPNGTNLFFRDTNSNIYSASTGSLKLYASTSMSIDAVTLNISSTEATNTGNFTNNGSFKLGTNGDELAINETSGDITIDVGTSDKDLIFTVNDGGSADTEVMRLDGSESSLLMATDKKIQFRDTTLTINSSSDGQLDIDADTEIEITAPTVDINASTEVNISSNAKVAGTLYLGTNQNELEISETSSDITIKNTISDKDITFNLNDGGVSKDILKLDASDNVVISTNMNTSNTFSLSQGSISISAPTTETLDFSQRSDFILTVSGGDTLTLASKNVNRVGQQGSIIVTQSSGTNSLTWSTSNGWYFPSATAPTLSSGTGIYDVFSYIVVETGGSKKILVMDATNFQSY